MAVKDTTPRFDPPEPMASLAAPGQSPYLDHWRERAGLAPIKPRFARETSAMLDALIDSAFAPPEGEAGIDRPRGEGAQAL